MRRIFKIFYSILTIIIIYGFLYWCVNLSISNQNISEQPSNTNNYSWNNFNESLFYPGIAIIADNRADLSIPSRVLNVLTHIPSTWPIQIIYGTSNYKYLIECEDLKPYIENGRIILTKLFNENLFASPNNLFTTVKFYEQIVGEKILNFQLDSLFCSNSPHKLTDYLQYDYIGAPWRMTSEHGMVGNSGFSLRTRSKTIELLTKHSYDFSKNEDEWFASHFYLVNASIPPVQIAVTFSVETQYYSKPLGVHMPGNYLNMKDYKALCKQCPEVRMIWPYCQNKVKLVGRNTDDY
ncbi:unnamed protein product [Rotaria sp. Silwood2]|nr:unnamed protein product [Rotaria sp. Silwood2]CAF4340708.1 unnamed protein product [Rotaria sp. Silwood2]CAF4359230.1 unnamed protein product [Rotaria sp. Silwood2]